MRITLVNLRRDIYPPLGLCSLSAYLKQGMPGAETALVEAVFGKDMKCLPGRVLETAPDIVGVTTYTVGYHEVVSFCREIRRVRPDLPVWLGGPHITSLPGTLPPGADLGVMGEGEETVLDLCREWERNGRVREEALNGIKGICYRRDDRIVATPRRELINPLDTIPPPDISLLDMRWYTGTRRFFIMEGYYRGLVLLTSRGCPYDCRFCQAAVQWGRCRYHSAERVVSELEGLREKYPYVNAVNIIDDLFIGSRKRLREIVRLIRERRLHEGVVFNVNGRANLVDREVLELLRSINVVQVAYGFESGTERILDFLKKGSVTLSHNHAAADLTNEYGISVGGQFMIGTPGETEEEIRETIGFIKAHRMGHAHLSVTTPLPGTELWELCLKKGLVSEEMDWRELDFGNPHNPYLIYINEDVIPRKKFNRLIREAQEACDIWNPPQTLRDYIGYLRDLPLREFGKKAMKKILSVR